MTLHILTSFVSIVSYTCWENISSLTNRTKLKHIFILFLIFVLSDCNLHETSFLWVANVIRRLYSSISYSLDILINRRELDGLFFAPSDSKQQCNDNGALSTQQQVLLIHLLLSSQISTFHWISRLVSKFQPVEWWLNPLWKLCINVLTVRKSKSDRACSTHFIGVFLTISSWCDIHQWTLLETSLPVFFHIMKLQSCKQFIFSRFWALVLLTSPT